MILGGRVLSHEFSPTHGQPSRIQEPTPHKTGAVDFANMVFLCSPSTGFLRKNKLLQTLCLVQRANEAKTFEFVEKPQLNEN